MEIRQLQLFVALSEEKNFTRAGQRMHIVQSGLSTAIKRLEEELGVQLFERTTREVVITEDGLTFLKHARAALGAVNTAKYAVSAEGRIAKSLIKVGIPTGHLWPYCRIGSVLATLRKRFPELEVELRTLSNDGMRAQLLTGEIDLALYEVLASEEVHGVSVTPFSDDPLVAICSSHNEAISSLNSIRLAHLCEFPFVDFTRDKALRSLVDRLLSKHDLTRRRAFEVSDVRSITELVDHNLGVAILPRRQAATSIKGRDISVISIDHEKADIPTAARMVLLTPTQTRRSTSIILDSVIFEMKRDATEITSNFNALDASTWSTA